jgi:hypothetical protein
MPNWASLLENAFWNRRPLPDIIIEKRIMVTYSYWNNKIDLKDCCFTVNLLVHDFTSGSDTITMARVINVSRCVTSQCFPILSKPSSGIKREHGQRPGFRRVLAMGILKYASVARFRWLKRWYVLLTTISGICEDTKIETAPDPIITVNHNTVNVRFQEFIIRNDRPLSMIEFWVATSHERTVWSLSRQCDPPQR